MDAPPKLSEIPHYPVVAGTALLAIGTTTAWWAKVDVSPLFESAMIRRGELWRLVTSIFPHLGILHLAFNVYWLWVFGTSIERVYGHAKTAALIVFFGVGSGSLEFAFSAGGAGLSGVGYGFFGLLWILASRDPRFRDSMDRRTVELFIGWFFLCIVTTVTNIMPVGNTAHGAGAVLGILTGLAITMPRRRALIVACLGVIVLFGLWAATLGRPRVNLSRASGYEEGQWGYEALVAQHYQDAARWLHDAVTYRPEAAEDWYDLGIAYQHLGNTTAAVGAYRKAADLGEANAQYFLGVMYTDGGEGLTKDDAQALYWFRKAADQGNNEAQNNVAWTYATSSDPAIRNPAAALDYARKAVSSEKDNPDPSHLDTLAEAYYANGQHEEAVKTEQQAIALASSDEQPAFQKNLERYRHALQEQTRRRSGK